MPERLFKYYLLRLQRVFRRLARSSGTPEHVALGAAIGMVVGMTPTVGFQMMLCIPICLLFRANPLAAVPIVWITNPVTLIPIYSFNYWLGTLLVRQGPRISQFESELKEVARISEEVGVWAGLKQLATIGWEIQLPLWTGCFLVGFTLAVPTYLVFYHTVKRIRDRMELRKRQRHERVRELLGQPPVAAADSPPAPGDQP